MVVRAVQNQQGRVRTGRVGAQAGGVPVDVFIFAGQSNAQVYNNTLSALPSYVVSDTGVKIWNIVSQAWQTYAASVNSDQPGNIGTNTGAFWGSEAVFAYNYRQANPTKTCYIVKCSVASTSLQQGDDSPTGYDWSPASSNMLFGITETNTATALAALSTLGLAPTVKAVFWMQGENDSTVLADANAYQTNLAAFGTAMRSRWAASSAVWVIGRVNDIARTYRAQVRAAQAAVAKSDSRNRLLSTDNFTLGSDNIHYNGPSTEQFGKDNWYAYNVGQRQLIANPTFDTDISGWSGNSYPGTGVNTAPDATVLSLSSNQLAVNSSTGHTYANGMVTLANLIVGATYFMSLNAGGTSPLVRISSSSGAPASGPAPLVNDAAPAGYYRTFTPTATTMYLFLFCNAASGVATFDNVYVYGP